MSPNKLHLECSLDKELYYHGETISVNVHIQVRGLIEISARKRPVGYTLANIPYFLQCASLT